MPGKQLSVKIEIYCYSQLAIFFVYNNRVSIQSASHPFPAKRVSKPLRLHEQFAWVQLREPWVRGSTLCRLSSSVPCFINFFHSVPFRVLLTTHMWRFLIGNSSTMPVTVAMCTAKCMHTGTCVSAVHVHGCMELKLYIMNALHCTSHRSHSHFISAALWLFKPVPIF